MNTYQEKLDSIVALYEQAIELARLEEREAIASLFDGIVWGYDYREIAARIRARGEVKTDDETCPHCGAMTDDKYPNKYYGCGTHINDPTYRFGTCYERQIEQLKQALIGSRQAVQTWAYYPEVK